MKRIIGLFLVLAVLVMIPAIDLAFAAGDEPGEYLDRRVIIWNLFFRMIASANEPPKNKNASDEIR